MEELIKQIEQLEQLGYDKNQAIELLKVASLNDLSKSIAKITDNEIKLKTTDRLHVWVTNR